MAAFESRSSTPVSRRISLSRTNCVSAAARRRSTSRSSVSDKGANGETVCHSEVYTSKQSAQAGVDAAKRVASLAQVHDRT
ncbi:YegP family protein [Aureimonas altamirensis]|uniref:YegP family protein n=1 Tax=Aureimonas altamirensis TaxID=370622 RepID=UPI003B97A883